MSFIAFIFLFGFYWQFFMIALSNFFIVKDLKNASNTSRKIKFSVLIPARNEESNIANLLESLSKQTYKPLEVIVMDDQSTDDTLKIAKKHKFVKVLRNKNMPKNWSNGKTWACFNLAKSASKKSDYLLFLDADVVLAPTALEELFKHEVEKFKLISVMPTQITSTFGETMIVPILNFIFMNLIPHILVNPIFNIFTVAVGQFILFEKKTYEKLQPHEKTKNTKCEDMNVGRYYKQLGYKSLMFLGADQVFCRMYEDIQSSLKGYLRWFADGFGVAFPVSIFIVTFYFVAMTFPVILMFSEFYLGLFFLGLIFLARFFAIFRGRYKIFLNLVLTPFHSLLFFVLSVLSIIKTEFFEITWRGRKIG